MLLLAIHQENVMKQGLIRQENVIVGVDIRQENVIGKLGLTFFANTVC